MLPSDPSAQAASDRFAQLLLSDPAGTAQQFAEAREAFRRQHLMVGDEVVPMSFAPSIISTSRWAPVQKQVMALMKILKRLEPMLLRPRWLNRLGISPAEQDLIRLPAGFGLGIHVSRVDGFLGPASGQDTGFRIVELNVDSPGGAAYLDACAGIFKKTEVWKRFCREHPGRTLPNGKRILNLLLKAWKLWGGMGKPRVGIVDWITVSTVSEFDVLKRTFNRSGIETVVCDPRELEFSKGRLRDYDGNPLDLVYRRVLVEDILAHGEDARALLDAYRAGAVCLVNPFRCKPLTVKSLLSVFHEPEMKELLSASDLNFLHTVVPWTAIVEDGPMLARIEAEQENLVLKPADSWGGQGLYLGWEVSAGKWREGIEEALKGRYVVQQRAHIPQATYPVAVDGGWELRKFRMDFNPYTFATSVGTPLVRLATSDTLNIKAGGCMTVSYLLD
jgi:uncharacterized circularly permuted ATP-grasp superfamily protein